VLPYADVRTRPEVLLGPAPYGAGTVLTHAPAIPSPVGPLQDALLAGQVRGQEDLQVEEAGLGARDPPLLLATVGVEEVCVHAGLARVLAGAGRRAHTEGEATPVV